MQIALDIIKKNVLSLVFLIIALLAIVALFWPLGGMYENLNTKLAQRKDEYNAADALAKKSRTLPRVVLDTSEPQALTVFPTNAVLEKGQKLTEDVATQAKAVLKLASDLNEHKPLVPNVLPEGKSIPAVNKYKEEYRKLMGYERVGRDERRQTLPVKILKAGLPPTAADVETEKTRRTAEIIAAGVGGAEDPLTKAKIAQMEATLVDDLKNEVMADSLMYVNADALDVYPGLAESATGGGTLYGAARTTQDVSAIYYAQIGLWVQEDIMTALAAANAGSAGITNAPVKHLVNMQVTEDAGRSAAPGTPGAAPGGPPVVSNPTVTSRTSNETYEVVPFTLTLNVDASQIPNILAELSRNRFITVLNCEMTTIDLGALSAAGFYYGPAPVVQLNIQGEELFLKSWLKAYIPAVVAAPPPAG